MTDLEFVKAYLAKYAELLAGKRPATKTSLQMLMAHEGRLDEELMSNPERWFTDNDMGLGELVAGRGLPRYAGGLRKDPVTIFVYGFVRDNLELFRKKDEQRTTTGIVQSP